MHIIAQQFDWLRFGPLSSTHKWAALQRRFQYIDVRRHNHFGRWYADLTGDQLEVIRTVECIDKVLNDLADIHWTRLDVAFDVSGVDLDSLACPGSAIVNDGRRETLYSHMLKARGDFPMFSRVYDAFSAGHDVDPGVIRCEVEFKLHMPDMLKKSELWPRVAFLFAAQEIAFRFGLNLPVLDGASEFSPTKRLLNHDRERFYARFGKRIVNDVVELGFDRFISWALDCARNGGNE